MQENGFGSLDVRAAAIVSRQSLLAEAGAALDLLRSGSGDWLPNAVSASEWVDRLVPLWRRAARAGQDAGCQPDMRHAPDSSAILNLLDGFLGVMSVSERSEAERRRIADDQLRVSLEDRELLSKHLIQAQESERRRIAAELHDSVGQSLSALKFTLERAVVMLQKPELGDPEPVIALALQRIGETSKGIRAISMNLRPHMLDTMGAASAIEWFCRDFAGVYGSLNVHTQISAHNSDVPHRISTHVFRCVQELLNNAAKHAHANTVSIMLRRNAEMLYLEVADDGVGMDIDVPQPTHAQGSGLRNLRERAEMTGGQFSLSSPPSGGTAVKISWVLHDEDRQGS